MRPLPTLLICLLAGPSLSETALRIEAGTSEATADLDRLSAALSAALAPGGERADRPLRLDANGDIPATLLHVAGPPAGWSLTVGPADAPVIRLSGAAGDMAAVAQAIPDHFCGPLGGAAYTGPWTASGGGPQISITGKVENLAAPFSLTGEFPGGTAIFEYTPVNMGGGAVEYSLSGSGVTGSGEGVYSLRAMSICWSRQRMAASMACRTVAARTTTRSP
jgi:hypothetical protein